MKQIIRRDLILNKLIAMALILIFIITVKASSDLVPVVAFLSLPTAIALIFSRRNWVE